MKKTSFQFFLMTFLALASLGLIGCGSNGPQAGNGPTDPDLTQISAQSCTPASGARGTRITCPCDMASADPFNIIFDTQLIPKSTITFNSNRSCTFVIPPAIPGLYRVVKASGDTRIVIAQEQVIRSGSSAGTGGSGPASPFAECAAGSNTCQVGYACRNNACVPNACDSTYTCPGGQICRNSQCVNSTNVCDDTHLDTARSCRDGLVCVHGACEPCRENSQCGAESAAYRGFSCQASSSSSTLGLCRSCTDSAQCGAGQICSSGQCGGCTYSAQCGTGNICNASSQCVSLGLSNPRLSIVVSESNDHSGLLKINWNVQGIPLSAIRDAYVYGPFGVDTCNNIIRNSDDVLSRDRLFLNGTACRVTSTAQGNTCPSTDSAALRSSSLETGPLPTAPAGSGGSPSTTVTPPGTPSGPSSTSEEIFMACRLPIRDQMTKNIYATLTTSPSIFGLVVVTQDNRVFTSQGRFDAGNVGLHVTDARVDPDNPKFIISGTYSRAEGPPTFNGCANPVYTSNSSTAGSGEVRFTQTCDFPSDGSLPDVSVSMVGFSGIDMEQHASLDNCSVAATAATLGGGNVYDTMNATRSVCPSRCLDSGNLGVYTPTSCDPENTAAGGDRCTNYFGNLELTGTIRRTCQVFINGVGQTTRATVPWNMEFNVEPQRTSAECGSPRELDTDHVTSTGDVTVRGGLITYKARLPRTMNCYTYQLTAPEIVEPVTQSYPTVITPGVTSPTLTLTPRWFYDFKIADSDIDGCDYYCHTNSQPDCRQLPEENASDLLTGIITSEDDDYPTVCRNVQTTSRTVTCDYSCVPHSTLAGTSDYHDSDDWVSQCTNYNAQITGVIRTRAVSRVNVQCCLYGEAFQVGSVALARSLFSDGRQLGDTSARCNAAPNGRYFETTLTPAASSTGGFVDTTFNYKLGGEALYCKMIAVNSTGTVVNTQYYRADRTTAGQGFCDYNDHDGGDANDLTSPPDRRPTCASADGDCAAFPHD